MNAQKRPADPVGVERSRRLRRDATDAERKLWNALRDRRLGGAKFRRQVPIGKFIADLCSREHRLIVELDGGQHLDRAAYDAHRTAVLEQSGYRVLRFWNTDVLTNLEGVLEAIWEAIEKKNPSP